MCGIAGIVDNHLQQGHKGHVQAMKNAIRYRGPDGNGIDEMVACTLGHVRLSIVDIAGGHQPMRNHAGHLGLVFNGEIYGYKEIRKELASDGYPFHTQGDTEVILALYEKYGREMLSRLPGMFAFAIWDERSRELFAARDRFGEKPFYYAVGRHGEFIFASEIKAILASGLIDPEIDAPQVAWYLNMSYVNPMKTVYKNIYTLPPAHVLYYHDGELSVRRYWSLPQTMTGLSDAEAVEGFKALFEQSVRRQLVADVPVCAFLSGGLDSGTVVAVASEYASNLTTLSFAFREGGVDESAAARSMAERYGTNHIELRDEDFDIAELLWKMQEIFDEPFADPAAIPAYLIAKHAREHAKVVITGDAGDEVLGGYSAAYRSFLYRHMYERRSKACRTAERLLYRGGQFGFRAARSAIRRLGRKGGWAENARELDMRIRLAAMDMADIGGGKTDVELHRARRHMLSDAWNMSLLGGRFDDVPMDMDGYLGGGAIDDVIRLDLLEYLPGNGLVKTDRTTMAVSLESRTPFLDVDLAEFCIAQPFHRKVRGSTEKWMLRAAFEEKWTVPVKTAIKNGFSPPFGLWLQKPGVKKLLEEYLEDSSAKIYQLGLVRHDAVQGIMRERRSMAWPTWSLLQLAMWCDRHPCR
ncbi:asparagine synthase (glutamine-hydrolyzing) [Selenomonas sp. TAMA-11512]|uniref:asparagine synthase (glutamine-hydrolyzing) n=1 Tax=Selenomonas sp. TAMA-11512 TaxID=3095337 RepID=UPI003091E2DC|nr:asparagine synthase (glutamine-hydrolyzing) [Selenomonas sp. TAMA-11512]